MIDYRVLGSLEVVRDGEAVDLGPRTQRAVLVLLLLNANEAVQARAMVDALWPEPPPSASKIVQNCVMRLRRVLPDDSLVTRGRGYELRVARDEFDVDRFSRAVDAGREALRNEDYSAALEQFDGALAEWRGEPLRDLDDPPFVDDAIRRLEGLRLRAARGRVEAGLALGRHAEIVDELEGLVRERPLDEHLRAQLMLALYRSGQQAAALEVYRDGRRILVDELGIEPGPELGRLEQAILRQESELDATAPHGVATPGARVGPRFVVVGALVVLAAAAVAFAVFRTTSGSASAAVPPDDVAVVDPSAARVIGRVPVGARPAGIAVVRGFVWVSNTGDGTLTEIDPQSREVIEPSLAVASDTTSTVTSIARLGDDVWLVDSGTSTVTRLATGVCCTIAHFPLPASDRSSTDFLTVTSGGGHIWLTSSGEPELLEIDDGTGRVVARSPLPGPGIGAVSGFGSVWCAVSRGPGDGVVVRVDLATGRTAAQIRLPGTPAAVTTGYGSVWVTVPSRDAVVEIDPATNTVLRTIPVPGHPLAVTAGLGAVWAATGSTERLIRIDPATGDVAQGIPLHGTPRGLTVAAGKVWVVGA